MGRISKKLTHIYNTLLEGNERGFLFYLIFPLLYPLSVLYGIGVRFRLFLYRIGFFKTRRLDCKVISIGNITVGGSGKTPMTMRLAQKLTESGKRVVVLSRGYRGRIKDTGVVSDGENILLGPEDAGDEPYLMAVKLKTIPVIVGRGRYKTGIYAIEKFNPDVIILDDGFQHIKLHRDIDILLVDSRRGFGNGYLFPAGMLREPLSGLKRASLILIKKSEKTINAALISQAKDCPVIYFSYKSAAIVNLANNFRLPVDALKGKKVIALSGIADPKSFKETLNGLGAFITKEISYPDHHLYTQKDVQEIAAQTKGADMVITTEKDAVKLKGLPIGHLPMYALGIDVEIEDLEIFEKTAGLS